MTRLLVSVRSAAEAEAALAGGAALIDVKEPANGPLGRAGDAAVAEVARTVAGRRPVSAALGELLESGRSDPPLAGLGYVKWGLAGCGDQGDAWRSALLRAAGRVVAINPACRVVAVAYADWRRAQAPPPDEVCAFAVGHSPGVFLLDTWGKDGGNLLDWLGQAEVAHLCERCRSAGVRVALAGSLGSAEVLALRGLGPDWFAVRGAVCRGGRGGVVEEGKVRRMVELVAAPP